MSLYLSVYLCMAALGSKSKCSKSQEMEDASLLSPLSFEKGKISEKNFFFKLSLKCTCLPGYQTNILSDIFRTTLNSKCFIYIYIY